VSNGVPARRQGEGTPTYYRRIYAAQGWRGIMRRLATPPRRFRPTKAGWIYFVFMLATISFAYATDNNLLFMLFAALLSVMSASGVLSEASLGPINVKRRLPAEVGAGIPFVVRYEIRNESKRLAAWAFRFRDAALFGQRPGPLMLHLSAGEEKSLEAYSSLQKRGMTVLPDYEICTQYPFLLFDKSRSLPGGESVLVLPRSDHPVRIPWLAERTTERGTEGRELESAGEGDSISYVRDLKDGEPVRRIDWRKSARYDRLFRKEFEQRRLQRVTVAFDPGADTDYEYGLEICASLLTQLKNSSVPFGLALGSEFSGCSEGAGHLTAQLRRLALYNGEKLSQPAGDTGRIIKVYGNGAYRIA